MSLTCFERRSIFTVFCTCITYKKKSLFLEMSKNPSICLSLNVGSFLILKDLNTANFFHGFFARGFNF